MSASNSQSGKIDLGMPFFMLAIGASVSLPGSWGNLPGWGRVVWIAGIIILAILGFAFLGHPKWPVQSESEKKELFARAKAEREVRKRKKDSGDQ